MELLQQTWLNLKANKTRSFLTMFGIAWGLICLILMTAVGEGMWVAQKEKARAPRPEHHDRLGRPDQQGPCRESAPGRPSG